LPDARLVELPGELPLWWEEPDPVLNVIEEFLVGERRGVEPTRVLATVLFTDIVGSTVRAEQVGDRRWRALLDTHDELAGRLVQRWGGRLVKSTGDGVLATFDGPGRAIGCAAPVREGLAEVGGQVRGGGAAGAAMTSAASRSTSPPGSWPPPARARSWSRGPCVTWSPAPRWSWPTAAAGGSRAWRATRTRARVG